jgi:predicted Zn-dependent peptidase
MLTRHSRILRLSVVLALVVGCVRAPAKAVPFVGSLPAGGISVVQPMSGVPAAAVELWYRAPSVGFSTLVVPSTARLAAEVVVASEPINGKSLGTYVRDFGGRISINVYADSIAISVLTPAVAAPDIVRVMTRAFFAPVITREGYQEAQRLVEQEALLSSFSADDVLRDTVFGALFRNGPAHYPVLGNAREVDRISLDAVRNYAFRAFRSQNAILTVAGAVDASVANAAVSGRPSVSLTSAQAEKPVSSERAVLPRFVTKMLDDAGGAYGWPGPPIRDERAATALDFIADYLFRSELGVVSRQLAQAQPNATVNGQFITLHDPGVFLVSFTGKNSADIKNTVDVGLAMMREPLDAATFQRARDAFAYHILADLQTPLAVADNFGWYTVEGDPDYAPGLSGDNGVYFRAMRSLTPAFVASTARKYLDKPAVTIVLSPSTHAVKKGSSP